MVPVTVEIDLIAGICYRWILRSARTGRQVVAAPWTALAMTEEVARLDARHVAEARGNPVAE